MPSCLLRIVHCFTAPLISYKVFRNMSVYDFGFKKLCDHFIAACVDFT